MEDVFFSYNDDNHYINFWFNREFLGSTENPMDLVNNAFNYGVEEGEGYTDIDVDTIELYIFDLEDEGLNEDEVDEIHCYLREQKVIDKDIWKLIVQKKWKDMAKLLQIKKLSD